jgi:hypothetical protein
MWRRLCTNSTTNGFCASFSDAYKNLKPKLNCFQPGPPDPGQGRFYELVLLWLQRLLNINDF